MFHQNKVKKFFKKITPKILLHKLFREYHEKIEDNSYYYQNNFYSFLQKGNRINVYNEKHVGTTLITESILIQYLLFFLVKGSNSATMDAPISYFTNPSYPETDWVPNYNTYTIKVRNTYIPNTFIMFSYSIQQYYASLNTTT